MKRPSTGGIVRVLIAISLTALVGWKSRPSEILSALAHARLGPIAAATALVFLDRALMAYRWLVLLRPFAGPDGPRFTAVMRIFFVSTFVGTFLPATVGVGAVRAYSLSREGVAASAAVASVVMDSVLGVFSLLLMAVVGLMFARQMAADPVVVGALVVTALGCAVAAAVVFSRHVDRWLGAIVGLLPWAGVRDVAGRLLGAMQTYAATQGALGNVLAGSIGVQALRIVQAYCLGVGLGIAQPLTTYVAFIPLILLVMLLPITVNGLGTSQAAFVWFFAQVGVASPDAFALSVLFVGLGVVGNLPGGVLYATGGVSRGSRNAGQPTT